MMILTEIEKCQDCAICGGVLLADYVSRRIKCNKEETNKKQQNK